MCGIITILNKDTGKALNKEQITIFKQMLYADALRGWDSTGIAAIKQTGIAFVFKDACPPASFFHKFQDHIWSYNNSALVGHNRSATRGKTNQENAHPFQQEHITLVHNGTLNFHHHIKNVEVDSLAITHGFAEKGAKATIEQLDGAFALVWHDKETGFISATRNSKRPLYIMETKESIILASEYELVDWICSRNNHVVTKRQLLTEGLIYTFKTNKKGMLYTTTEKVDLFIPKPVEIRATVHQIAPYKTEERDATGIGKCIEVLAYKLLDTASRPDGLGKHRWLAESMEYPNIMVEFYTDSNENYSDELVSISISKKFYNAGLKSMVIFGENPITLKKKTTADSSGPMRTSNGVELTDQTVLLCEDKYCEECCAAFEVNPESTLNPIVINGHVYNYRYICAGCTDYLSVIGKFKHA